MKWEKQINGKHLRTLIGEHSTMGVLLEIYSLTNKLLAQNVYYENDFEELRDLLAEDISMSENELTKWIVEDSHFTSVVEYIDDKLDWFYDLCDREQVWITV